MTYSLRFLMLPTMVESQTESVEQSGGESLELTSRHTLFIGRGDYAIDDKGRLTVPTHMRVPLLDGGVMSPMGGRASIWASWTFDLAVRELRNRVTRNGFTLDLVTGFLHSAVPIKLDTQGRVVVPPAIRVECGLERDVIVLGSGPRIEVVAAASEELDGLAGVSVDVIDALAEAGF